MIKTLLGPIFKKYSRLIISMALITAFAIAVYSGLAGAYKSLEKSCDIYIDTYNYADVVITTNLTAANIKTKLEEIDGVSGVNQRLIYDTPAKLENGRLVSGRLFYYQQDNFLDMHIWEESIDENCFNIAIEKKFADSNKLKAGDFIDIKVNNKYQNVRIGQIVSSPECLSNVKDKFTMGENSDFGMFFVSSENNFLGAISDKIANQFLLMTEEGADNQAVMDKANQILEKRTAVLDSFIYENSGTKGKIRSNLSVIEKLTSLAPYFFYIIMVCVCSLFLIQIIRQSRREIGILKSQGFQNGQIRLIFCILSFVTNILGSVLGVLLGFLVNYVTNRIFIVFLIIPVTVFSIDVKTTIISLLITPIAGQISAFIGTLPITSIHPSEAMARDVSDTFKINFKSQGRFFSPNLKLAVFSMLRNIKGFVFSAICMCGTIALILSAIEYDISKELYLKELYDKRMQYDCQIIFTKPISDQTIASLQEIDGFEDYELVQMYRTQIGDTTVNIHAFEPDHKLTRIPDSKQKDALELPENGIILDDYAAEQLGVTKGSAVEINGEEFTVYDISLQNDKRTQYMSTSEAKRLGTPDRWAINCVCKNDDALLDVSKDLDGFSNATFTKLVKQNTVNMLKTHVVAVCIIIGISMIMGFIIVLNTTQTNLSDMKKELSVLRSLGFQVSDISKIWFIQTMCQFAISLVAGLPLGKKISFYVLKKLTGGLSYPFIAPPSLYIITSLIVFVYIVASHFSAMNSIKKWDITENIKEKE